MASEKLERDIYAGTIHVAHNPLAKGSQPRYKVDNKTVKGVTTILGAVLAKDFVGWALSCMAEALTDKLPIITEADIADAKLASARKRDAGADTGSETHKAVETWLKPQGVVNTSELSPEALKAFNAFSGWFKRVKPKVLNVEELVYSQEFGYCGTYDCMLKIDGKVYLCDLKTTNVSRKAPKGVYAEYFIQLGAYAQAHEEERLYTEKINIVSDLPKIDGLMVISAKKNGKLDIVTNENLDITVDECKSMFKKVMNLYSFLNYLTKALGGK